MNVLDENVPEGQAATLRGRRMAFRQIGQDIGQSGMQDNEIVPLLHELGGATFFTLDEDFSDQRLCHQRYCIVYLDVKGTLAAQFIRRVLRHAEFNTKAKDRRTNNCRDFPNVLISLREMFSTSRGAR